MSLFIKYAGLDKDAVLQQLHSQLSGLSSTQVTQQKKIYGKNEFSVSRLKWHHILLRQLRSPFIYILIAIALFSAVMGEWIDAGMVTLFIVLNTVLGFFQEYRSEKAVQLLNNYVSDHARVRRNDQEDLLDARELVPGDIVILEKGDKVPADIRLLDSESLAVDESILTGESIPVNKHPQLLTKPATLHTASNILFGGTYVVGGKGTGIVYATGQQMVSGDIIKLTDQTKRVSSFEKGIQQYSQFILKLVLLTLSFTFVLNLILKGTSSFFELLFFSTALAISVIPEALQVVTTVALSQGAVCLAKKKVVVKRLSAIEDLGSIQVLCTDKTGTITTNQMAVQDVYSQNQEQCLFYARIAASFISKKKQHPNNSFDLALDKALTPKQQAALSHYTILNSAPFDPETRRNCVLIKKDTQQELIVRGAPEAILSLCSLSKLQKAEINSWSVEQGRQGCRVIAIATTSHFSTKENTIPDPLPSCTLLGLISFADPVKPSTIATIDKAKKLGVQVKILTGDAPEVAGAVGFQTGLADSPDAVITGEDFFKLPKGEQLRLAENLHVFARLTPQDKHQLIELLMKRYEVGFLGDGINDAPALKKATVAIVVKGAADIAVEAADVVLLAQDLAVVIEGVKRGRDIFTNTVKYLKATLASNFGNFFALAAASLISPILPMLPLQILLLNLLSDFPMIAIATDTVEADEVRSPKTYQVKEVILFCTLLGLVSTLFDFTFFAIFSRTTPAELQTYWFIGSVLTELAFIFSVRAKKPFWKALPPSKVLVGLAIVAALSAVTIPWITPLRILFDFVMPQSRWLVVIGLVVGLYFIASELVKRFYYSLIHPVSVVKEGKS